MYQIHEVDEISGQEDCRELKGLSCSGEQGQRSLAAVRMTR